MYLRFSRGCGRVPQSGGGPGWAPVPFVEYPPSCRGFTRLSYFTGVFCICGAVYPSLGSCCNIASNISFPFVVSLSLIWFSALVSLYRWKLSNIFSILPFLVTWIIFIMSSIFPIACPLSRRCWANFYLLLFYLKSLIFFFLESEIEWLSVCPMYVILQSGQVNRYTLLLLYLCSMEWLLPILLFVVNATVIFVSLNNLLMKRVSFLTYVNVTHIRFWVSVLWFCFFNLCSSILGRDRICY